MGREEGREGGCFVYLIFSLAQIINCLMHCIFFTIIKIRTNTTAEKWNIFNGMQRCPSCHWSSSGSEMYPT